MNGKKKLHKETLHFLFLSLSATSSLSSVPLQAQVFLHRQQRRNTNTLHHSLWISSSAMASQDCCCHTSSFAPLLRPLSILLPCNSERLIRYTEAEAVSHHDCLILHSTEFHLLCIQFHHSIPKILLQCSAFHVNFYHTELLNLILLCPGNL